MKATAIIKAGLLVGTLDILSAFIYVFIKTGKYIPFSILKFIASGIFGREALTGGGRMILTGLVIHYIIAFAFTILFFWLVPKVKIISRNIILSGIVYGIFYLGCNESFCTSLIKRAKQAI